MELRNPSFHEVSEPTETGRGVSTTGVFFLREGRFVFPGRSFLRPVLVLPHRFIPCASSPSASGTVTTWGGNVYGQLGLTQESAHPPPSLGPFSGFSRCAGGNVFCGVWSQGGGAGLLETEQIHPTRPVYHARSPFRIFLYRCLAEGKNPKPQGDVTVYYFYTICHCQKLSCFGEN